MNADADSVIASGNLGVLGMAMRHADTAIDALATCLSYPQLSWGHSRLVVRSGANTSQFSFSMDRPSLRGATAGDSDRMGYAEPAVFSRACSGWVGVSPLRWRKNQAAP